MKRCDLKVGDIITERRGVETYIGAGLTDIELDCIEEYFDDNLLDVNGFASYDIVKVVRGGLVIYERELLDKPSDIPPGLSEPKVSDEHMRNKVS